MYVMSHLTYHYYYMPMQQELLSKHWPDAAPIYDLLRSKVDLTLVNNHFTLAYPAPMSPNVVEIGGIQISEKAKPLPKVSGPPPWLRARARGTTVKSLSSESAAGLAGIPGFRQGGGRLLQYGVKPQDGVHSRGEGQGHPGRARRREAEGTNEVGRPRPKERPGQRAHRSVGTTG